MSGFRQRRPPDRIARYLFWLRCWAPRRCRADLTAEARRHLYDAVRQAEAAGLATAAAQRAAIRTFGPAWRIGFAARFGGRFLKLPIRAALPCPPKSRRSFERASPRRRPPAWRRVRRTLAGWTRR